MFILSCKFSTGNFYPLTHGLDGKDLPKWLLLITNY